MTNKTGFVIYEYVAGKVRMVVKGVSGKWHSGNGQHIDEWPFEVTQDDLFASEIQADETFIGDL